MPTATLKFKLPEEHTEYLLAQMGTNLHSAIHSFDQKLRIFIKHGSSDYKDLTPTEVLEKVRGELHELLEEYNIDLYNL